MSRTIILGSFPRMNPIDPNADKSARAARFSSFANSPVSSAHLAGRCAAAFDRFAADDPPHRRIAPETVGVVHILVSGEASIDRLAKQTDDAMPPFLPVRLSARTSPANTVSPRASSSSR